MQFVYNLLSIRKDFRWLPTRRNISGSGPLNEMMKLPIKPFGVGDAISFPFFRVVDDHRVTFAGWLA